MNINNLEKRLPGSVKLYGTPLYVYDAGKIIQSYNKLKYFCGENSYIGQYKYT